MSQKESEWEETKKEFLEELKQALQNNIPHAVDTEFSKFLPAVEKYIDTIVSQREKEIAEEVEKMVYQPISAHHIVGQLKYYISLLKH